ncbi:MAG: acyl-CoA dehydrogenase family protein, partial [bacterium]
MDFEFTELQQSVRRMMKDFVDREVRPIAMEYELEDRYPAPIVEKMQELGFFGFTIPEEYGGSGMDEVCYAIA